MPPCLPVGRREANFHRRLTGMGVCAIHCCPPVLSGWLMPVLKTRQPVGQWSWDLCLSYCKDLDSAPAVFTEGFSAPFNEGLCNCLSCCVRWAESTHLLLAQMKLLSQIWSLSSLWFPLELITSSIATPFNCLILCVLKLHISEITVYIFH